MMRIPQDRQWVQTNRSDILGNLVGTFNCDFNTNQGKAKFTRTKKLIDSTGDSELGLPIAFAQFNGEFYSLIADDNSASVAGLFVGGASASDGWTAVETDNDSPTSSIISSNDSDMALFNGKLYLTAGDEIYSLDATAWADLNESSNLTANTPHLLLPYGDRLYITDNHTSIFSLNTSDTLVTSSTNTLLIEGVTAAAGNNSLSITKMLDGGDRMWIGTQIRRSGRGFDKGYIYEWDGVTSNTPTRIYELQSPGVVTGVMKDGIPYFLDVYGRLLAFNGSSFVEVGRLPVDGEMLYNAITNGLDKFVHANGMIVSDDEILMLVNNQIADNATEADRSVPEFLHSGVWAYNETNGIYHKYSPSFSEDGDTGTTNLTDYGQMRLSKVGALYDARKYDNDAAEYGQLLMGVEFADGRNAILTDDEPDTTQKYGSLVTTEIHSSQITDAWQKLFVKFRKLLNATDEIWVKYRVEETDPIYGDINWLSTTSFTSLDDLSGVAVGDEVEVIQGTGSGKTAHVTAIESSTNTYTVTVDEVYQGATGTGKARFQKWKKAGSYSDTLKQFHEFPVGQTDTWIQFKVCFQVTGKAELHELVVINKPNILAE